MQNCHRGKNEELKKGKEKKRRNCIENGVKGPENVGLVFWITIGTKRFWINMIRMG